jgi:hypothetical protein
MNLPWTWYLPGMKGGPEALEAYQEKDFAALRNLGVKFYDVTHRRWCLFPDGFKEELYRQGVLQEYVPKPKPLPLLKPQQGELF